VRASFEKTLQGFGNCIAELLIAGVYGRAGDRARTAAQLGVVRAHPIYPQIKEAALLAPLADASHVLGDSALARELYPVLLPHRHRLYHLGPLGHFIEPPYSRQLGLLAEVLGELDDAVRDLDEAESSANASGLRAHFARLRYELAGALMLRGEPADRERARALLEDASALAAALGQRGLAPRIAQRMAELDTVAVVTAPPKRQPAQAAHFELEREGDYWTLACGERTLRLRDSRGLQVLAQLVSRPGEELHVLQLASWGTPSPDRGDAGDVLDDEAVRAYRRRLLDLRQDLEEAEDFADAGRAERARAEIEHLTQELARAVGLGGRSRRAGGASPMTTSMTMSSTTITSRRRLLAWSMSALSMV
jgi:hypothetical protein